MEVRVMQEVLQEIVAVLIKHGVNVELDSAMLEIDEYGEVVFRCVDLNRVDWNEKKVREYLDRMRMFN